MAYLDRNVGRVLDTLRRLNLEEDTFVVYMADHGYCLGQHGRFEKHCGYDPALRVPLHDALAGQDPAGRGHRFHRACRRARDHRRHDGRGSPAGAARPEPAPLSGEGAATSPRHHIFSEYLENEEAFVRTEEWKFIFCSGKRKRTDGYETDNPTPGRYIRLYDLKKDPGEFFERRGEESGTVADLKKLMLDRFRATHPEAAQEPARLASKSRSSGTSGLAMCDPGDV